jgi:TonB family protein
MNATTCGDAEILAGAIALGEACDSERDAYRLHLSGCGRCVETLGGEREIERVMQRVADARDTETWEPSIRPLRARRQARTGFAWGLATLAIMAGGVWAAMPHGNPAATLPAHVTVAAVASVPAVRAAQSHALKAAVPPAPRRIAPAGPPEHKLIVVHNVVRLTEPAAATRHTLARNQSRPAPQPPAAKAPTSSDERTVADTGTTGVPAQSQRAESLALLPAVVRDVVPVGGDNVIAPHPSRIAYYENAEGTTAIDVSVDERGSPVKCTVAKSSGYLVLDESVCTAAMRVHYVPRSVNGRPVTGVYHDAFTFRAGDYSQTPQ